MAFDYSTTGLPDNQKFKVAAAICKSWLDENMAMFGDDGIANFMKNQPVHAAKLIMEKCDDWSEESVVLVLMGPAKDVLFCPTREQIEESVREEYAQYKAHVEEARKELGDGHPDVPQLVSDEEAETITQALIEERAQFFAQRDQKSREFFGDRAIELMKYLAGMSAVNFDEKMPQDATRIAMVEALSNMNDQIIGRKRIDRHHQVRWEHLKGHEALFAEAKGQNPGLDVIFEKALKDSRAALEALDDAAKNDAASKKGHKPPSM